MAAGRCFLVSISLKRKPTEGKMPSRGPCQDGCPDISIPKPLGRCFRSLPQVWKADSMLLVGLVLISGSSRNWIPWPGVTPASVRPNCRPHFQCVYFRICTRLSTVCRRLCAASLLLAPNTPLSPALLIPPPTTNYSAPPPLHVLGFFSAAVDRKPI